VSTDARWRPSKCVPPERYSVRMATPIRSDFCFCLRKGDRKWTRLRKRRTTQRRRRHHQPPRRQLRSPQPSPPGSFPTTAIS